MDRVGVGMGGKRATPSSQAICDSCMLEGGKTISLVISHPDAGLLAFQNTQYQGKSGYFHKAWLGKVHLISAVISAR